MYHSYRAYVGAFPEGRQNIQEVLDGITRRKEVIISVVSVGPDHLNVIIVTKEN